MHFFPNSSSLESHIWHTYDISEDQLIHLSLCRKKGQRYFLIFTILNVTYNHKFDLSFCGNNLINYHSLRNFMKLPKTHILL